jgi:hypothetical protein
MSPSKRTVAIAGLLAVAVVAAPTLAGAASTIGARVTITGPNRQLAAVVGHRLATDALPALEPRPFSGFDRMANDGNGRVVLVGPTTRAIALSSLTASATGGPAAVRLRAVEPTDGNCGSGHVVTVRAEEMSFVVPGGSTQAVALPSPLIVRPVAGHPVCLVAFPDITLVPASEATLTVSASGYLR